jgi:hypothetical protein
MKTKITLTATLACLLLLASTLTYSQDNRTKHKKSETTSSEEVIESVVPNLSHHSISLTFSNLDPQEDYKILLYNSDKELMHTYSIDGNEMTLFVGSIAPSNYELVVLKRNEVVDKKEIYLQ